MNNFLKWQVRIRLLRCECTPWEAHGIYNDSKRLYQKQRAALMLQALYRRRKAENDSKERLQSEVRTQAEVNSLRSCILYAINQRRSLILSLCFMAWLSALHQSWKARHAVQSALNRLLKRDKCLAFNTWMTNIQKFRHAVRLLTLAAHSVMPWARLFRVWAARTKARYRAFQTLNRAFMALLLRELRFAMTTWQSSALHQKQVCLKVALALKVASHSVDSLTLALCHMGYVTFDNKSPFSLCNNNHTVYILT